MKTGLRAELRGHKTHRLHFADEGEAVTSYPSKTVYDCRHLRQEMRTVIETIRKYEEDKVYAEYCEGILEACRAALTIITGD